MENLIEAITNKKPVVVWNPYETNDTLLRSEFLLIVKLKGYTQLHFDGNWITAYQKDVKVFGNETLEYHLAEAKNKNLNIYAAILEEELRINIIKNVA
jgi:hypothetical protein